MFHLIISFLHPLIPFQTLQDSEILKTRNIPDHLHPILGYTGWKTGLIYNLRFFGNYIKGEEDGRRVWAEDQSNNDPIWEIIKILFPSTGGQLSTKTAHPANIGRYINDPLIVSDLLKFTQNARFGEKENVEALVDGIFNYYQTQFPIGGTDKKPEPSITAEKLVNHQITINAPYPHLYKLKWLFYIENKGKIQKNVKGIETLKTLLNSIQEGVGIEEQVLYPRYFIEQVLLTFFWMNFDKEATSNLLDQLLGNLVDITPQTRTQTATTIQETSVSPEETFKIIQFADMFNVQGRTPYGSNLNNLVSNGLANIVDTQQELNIRFADCVETTIRHILNIVLWGPNTDSYNLDSIKESHKPFFQTQEDPNDGSSGRRTYFNKLVAQLPNMNYVRSNGNELASGFINVMTVLNSFLANSNTGFTKKLEDLKTSPEISPKNEKEIKLLLEEILRALNPSKKISIENLSIRSVNRLRQLPLDYYGTASIKLDDYVTFDIMLHPGHGEIQNAKDASLQTFDEYNQSMSVFNNKHPTLDSIQYLQPTFLSNNPNFYAFFCRKMQDAMRYLLFFKQYSNLPNNFIFMPTLITPFNHILEAIPWNDHHGTVKQISPYLLKLLEKEGISERITTKELSLNLDKKNIGDTGARTLRNLAKSNLHFLALDLSFNNIGPEGADALSGLKDSLKLRTLELILYGNNIGESGAKSLIKLTESKSLESLGLNLEEIGLTLEETDEIYYIFQGSNNLNFEIINSLTP